MSERTKSGRAAWTAWAVALTTAFVTSFAAAEPPPPERIPDVLEPWIPWVLEDLGEEACPLIGEVRSCVWPSSLELAVTDTGGSFTLRVTVDQRQLALLPGSAERWPEDVKVEGKAAPVVEHDGAPALLFERGTHVVTGRFSWSEVPDSLQAPANLGTLALTVRGQRVTFPKREDTGLIWLAQGGGSDEESDRLDLTVHRRLNDGVPLVAITRIQVSASGKAREVVLPKVLIPGTRAIRLDADLPAQLERDGTLRLQAQGGNYQVEITAIRETPADAFTAPSPGAPWPESETWVWVSNERLRHAELTGAAQIDPARTDLASDWLNLPTYVMPAGGSLAITTRRRGEPEPPPNHLELVRDLWLDLDGDGYTVKDTLTGTLRRDFRLDLTAGELGHAVVGGVDELVTQKGEHAGVELRSTALNLATEWRLPHGMTTLPAVGYGEDVQSLRAQLHLPPGFRLLGTRGVDDVNGTWLDCWDLFDFFFVLVISLAVAKLCGRGFGVVALVALVITHEESGAPTITWVLLLVATALVRVIKDDSRFGKVVRLAWLASLIGVLLVAIPFAVEQVRSALYPHLYGEGLGEGIASYSQALTEAAPAAPPPAEPVQVEEEELKVDEGGSFAADTAQGYGRGGRVSIGSSKKSAYARTEVDANAVVQTGPGVPSWNFRTFYLNWSGPVEKGQDITLWLSPPALTRLWSLLNVLFSAGLLLAFVLAARKRTSGASVPPAAALVVLSLALFAPSAQAQEIPPSDVLATLRERLTAGAACEPNCVSVERLDVTVDGARLALKALVHAGATTAYRAPGPLETWAPESVRVDGKESLASARFNDGFLLVRLERGLHTVELAGPIAGGQALTLALGTPPHRVTARAPGWEVEGLRADGHVEGSLVLRREVQADEGDSRSTQSLAQWLEVRREFDLGVRFRVHTTITRLGPATESLLVRLPLLPGEAVLDSGVTTDGKSALVELARDEDATALESTLPIAKRLDLTAAVPGEGANVARPWNETWVVRCSALYHCTFGGIAPVARAGEDGLLAFTYEPWPGESVSIEAQRLDAAKGASVTIDSAELVLTPGARMEQASLTLQVRTSRGTTERVALPPGGTLTSLTVDGQSRPARVVKDGIEVQLDPGSHAIVVALQAARGIDMFYRAHPPAAARPLVNVTTTVQVPDDRWLLWVSGPSWGPAVLFWGYLLVVLMGAFALSRVPHTPLTPASWLLLGLGLTQVPVPVVVVIVGWLFALAARERAAIRPALLFNATQVALVFWTVVALSCLAFAVHQGLVIQPDMQVQGMGSTNTLLRWYVDRTDGHFPAVGLVSLPLWIYKGLMLLWALWLAASLIRWLRWGFAAFRTGGAWRAREPRTENPRVPLEKIAEAQAALDAAAGEASKPEPPAG